MEYYEQEFLDFEDYAVMVGKTIQSSAQNPYANSDFMLHNFAKYEKFWKKESRKEWKKCIAKQNQALKKAEIKKKMSDATEPHASTTKSVKVVIKVQISLAIQLIICYSHMKSPFAD